MGYPNANRWPMSKRHSINLVECKDCGELRQRVRGVVRIVGVQEQKREKL